MEQHFAQLRNIHINIGHNKEKTKAKSRKKAEKKHNKKIPSEDRIFSAFQTLNFLKKSIKQKT